MKKAYWYRWVWANGLVTICKGYDRTEMYWMVKNNGALISKTREM